jgi:hypothetical protein
MLGLRFVGLALLANLARSFFAENARSRRSPQLCEVLS